MRLRKKPWLKEAIKEFSDIVILSDYDKYKGKWHEIFGNNNPIYVEVGTGKGKFITQLALENPNINFIGIEAQVDVLYYAAQKANAKQLANLKLVLFDVNDILEIFDNGEINKLYINFCDPWPKNRHAKRRLTHRNFLNKYRVILAEDGEINFKTDNEKLFEFSLNEFCELHLYLKNISLDLHNSNFKDNIMTEYEEKFSKLGMKIFRCEVRFR